MSLGEFAKKAISSNQLGMEAGEIELLDFRMAMLPAYTLTKMVECIYESHGKEAFEILFEAGKSHGEYAIDELGRKHDISRKQFADQTLESANILGLGEFSMEKFNPDEGKAVYKVENSPFVKHFRESDVLSDLERSIDELQRGMFHTTTREMFDKEVRSRETHCEFQGDDYCRFIVETK
jgi:predicted hydrocarbon binding protein